MSARTALLLAAGATAASLVGGYAYMRLRLSRLSASVAHRGFSIGPASPGPASVPAAASEPSARVFSDGYEIRVPASRLPDVPRFELMSRVMRAGMAGFVDLPQGRMFRFMFRNEPPEILGAATPGEVRALGMEVGDTILKIYKVASRAEDGSKAEVTFGDGGAIAGCLTYGIRDAGDGNITLSTETLMWNAKDVTKGDALPMAHAVPRFFHEYASMSLLQAIVDELAPGDGR
ncbi:hypothetical protein DFJ74DRAFT_706376 [Hyaloraphidium curvatum]|nr:hypothetical protein DFJ74DRAFT_706376 [Hyaloraphidium curvatum]